MSISQIQTSINSRFSIQNKNTFGSAAASDLCGLVGMFMDDISIDWEVCEDVKNYHQIICDTNFLNFLFDVVLTKTE